MRARTGKIARLPLRIREELNERLLENEPASKILPWLNGLDETATVIREMGSAGGHQVGAIDDNNLSDWRRGGFQDWVRRKQAIEQTREMAKWSAKLAEASGGNISEGASAILAGHLLELLEELGTMKAAVDQDGQTSAAAPERMAAIGKVVDQVSKALANVRHGDHNRAKLDLERERLAQGAEGLELERQKFRRTTCELFVKWAEDARAKEIASGSASNGEKIERLGQLMFGEDWGEGKE